MRRVAAPAPGVCRRPPRPARPLGVPAHARPRRLPLDRRGDLGRHRLAPGRRRSRPAAPGRLAARLLPPAPRVDRSSPGRARRRCARRPWSSPSSRSRRRSGPGEPLRPRGRLDLRRDRGRAALPDAVRAGSAHVRPRRAPLRARGRRFLHAFAFGRRRYVPAFAALLALLLYTHYWALFLALGMLAALAALIVSAAREDRRRLLVDGVLAFGLAGLAFAPWLPTLAFQLEHTGAPWSNPPPPRRARRPRSRSRPPPQSFRGSPPDPPRGGRCRRSPSSAGVTLAAGWASALVEPAGRAATWPSSSGRCSCSAARRSPASARSASSPRRDRLRLGTRPGADREEQRRRCVGSRRREPPAGRPGRLDPARAGARSRALPPGRPPLRDAARAGGRPGGHGLARRPPAARDDRSRARAGAAPRRAAARRRASSSWLPRSATEGAGARPGRASSPPAPASGRRPSARTARFRRVDGASPRR